MRRSGQIEKKPDDPDMDGGCAKTIAFLILLLLLTAVVLLTLSGCANLPFDRTYSVSFRDGKQEIGMSATFSPRKGLAK